MKRILIAAAALALATGSAFAATTTTDPSSQATTTQTAPANGSSVTAMNGTYMPSAQTQASENAQAPNTQGSWNVFSDGQAGDGGGN